MNTTGELVAVHVPSLTCDGVKTEIVLSEDQAKLAEVREIPLDRLRAIAEAERDGRLVVLPCKVDTLRRSIDANVSEEVCLVEAEGLSRYGNCHLTCFDCYVNALAKAEAEAALAGKEMK